MADFHRSLDRAIAVAERIVICAACDSENTAGNVNEQGLWFGYCLTCGCRFWDNSPGHLWTKDS